MQNLFLLGKTRIISTNDWDYQTKTFCTFCSFLHTIVLDFLNGTLEVLRHRKTIYYHVSLGYPQSFATTDSDFFPITKLLHNPRIQQTLKKSKTYFAASLRSVTFLVFPFPSLNVVWFPTVNTPFFVEKSGKHLFRTIQNIKTKSTYYISRWAPLLSMCAL